MRGCTEGEVIFCFEAAVRESGERVVRGCTVGEVILCFEAAVRESGESLYSRRGNLLF